MCWGHAAAESRTSRVAPHWGGRQRDSERGSGPAGWPRTPRVTCKPCTWQHPHLSFLLTRPFPAPFRSLHRKLFLINGKGKLVPLVTSRDVRGSDSNGSRCLQQHILGCERPGPGRVLLLPAPALWVCRGNPGPCSPGGPRTSSVPPPPPRPAAGS